MTWTEIPSILYFSFQLYRLNPFVLQFSAKRETSDPELISNGPMAQAAEEWYKQMPIITRSYLTAALVTTIGCSLDIISPYNLYLSPRLVVKQYQFWRLVTNFLYFRKMVPAIFNIGVPDLDFMFHMFFLAQYCKLLEENSFRGRTADFFYMLLFGASVLTGTVLIGGMIPYLSESFAKTGMIAGHAYYFLEQVYPKMTGRRPLRTPSFIKALFAEEPVVVARPANLRFAAPAADLHQD